MKDKSQATVICADAPYPNMKGCWRLCDQCGDKIFLSDSTVRCAEQNGFKPADLKLLCFYCGSPKIKSAEQFVPMTEEQTEEVLSYFRGKTQ